LTIIRPAMTPWRHVCLPGSHDLAHTDGSDRPRQIWLYWYGLGEPDLRVIWQA